MKDSDNEYLLIDIDSATLTKNLQILGVGKMDPFLTLTLGTKKKSDGSNNTGEPGISAITRTPTHWDAHKEPIWFHECHRIPTNDKDAILSFTVFNDSETRTHAPKKIGSHDISIGNLLIQAQSSKQGSLGLACSVQLQLSNDTGTIILQVKVKDFESFRKSQRAAETSSAKVNPSWFESPVVRLGVSGGTAPFFKLELTETGVEQYSKQDNNGNTTTVFKSYFIGKDLAHAVDERDFYEQILQIQAEGGEQDAVALMAPFMFDYLGVLETTADDADPPGTQCQLLVMQNLRNDYSTFRMLDLKMGQQTAQGGWQGKSRVAALRQSLLDGVTNSRAEGYRLEGFDGCPKRVDSMDPWIDFLAKNSDNETSQTTLWGRELNQDDVKKARRIMMQQMTGTDIFRYFMDVHLDLLVDETESPIDTSYQPVEVAEVVLHEFVGKLVHLAVICHKVQVPQKWIGSSVALGYDAGLYPDRASPEEAEQSIQAKVVVNVFDWGRSELLTLRRYKTMTVVEQSDRQRFWDNYKNGMEQLAYNAARAYYHSFTNTNRWTEVTLQVMDFDSMTADDYIGKVTFDLPDPSEMTAVQALEAIQMYQLYGYRGQSGKIYASITWIEFPATSRLLGSWRVTIDRAENLPAMDSNQFSDPYCSVIARDGSLYDNNSSREKGVSCFREFHQMTCVKARTLNPEWNETIDVPILRAHNGSSLVNTLAAHGVVDDPGSLTEPEMAGLFRCSTSAEWSTRLREAAKK